MTQLVTNYKSPSWMGKSANILAGLNVFTRPLSPSDVPNCVIVESTFPEYERCSEEKFLYRLTTCPDLSLGVFVGEKLIGHVIATRISSLITEGSMGMPHDWQSLPRNEPVIVADKVIGNDPNGNNLAIHSVAIVPEYQGKGVGKALVNTYTQYIKNTGVSVEDIVLIAHDHLIRFYEGVGFQNRGPSACTFAGGGWFDMIYKI